MDLSVIVPCHNLGKYVGHLLQTLSSQKTGYDVEYIFVLDDCTDNTASIIQEAKLPNCSIMTCCVHSAGLARNIGLEQSVGDYVWFIDGDDWLLDDYAFEVVLDNIKAEHANRIQVEWESTYKQYKVERHAGMVWRFIFSREFLHGLRFSNIQPHQDVYFMDSVFEKERANPGLPLVRLIKKPLYYYYYDRPGSNITQFREKGRIDP